MRPLTAWRYGWGGLTAYGLLGLPLAALGLPLVVYLPQYYEAMPTLGVGLVGALVLIARLVDVISDPLVGLASDRWPTRFGRRLPWIAVGTPLLMLSAWYLFVPGGSASGAYLLLWLSLAYLGWTLIYLPYTALGAEMSSGYNERSGITAFREGFFALGTLIAILLPALVQAEGPHSGAGLRAIALFLLLSLPLATAVLLWRIREAPCTRRAPIAWRQSWALLKANRPFRRLLITHVLNGAANGLPAVLVLYYVTEILGASRAAGGVFLTIYFLSAVAGLPLWLWVGRDWSKHRLWCASMLWVSAVFPFTLFLGEGDYVAYGAICVLGGACLGVDQAIPASIQADVIDEDSAAGGDGRAGIYFGLWSMATKLALALAIGVAFQILAWVGFESGTDNGAAAHWTIKLLYGLLPVLVKL
ncbi:MAG: MFS transporter, partial [Salinisphaera sp.]|nr:MFS transporter [Salinisphaera sp.]